MAAGFTVQQVRDLVFAEESDNDESIDSCEDVNEDEEKLEKLLDGFDGGYHFNHSFFKENAIRVLMPLMQVAKPSEDLAEQPLRLKAASLLSNININAGSLLKSEVQTWLKQIGKRLAGKVSIRRPYQGELQRNIPYEMFKVLKTVIKNADDEMFRDCCISTNRKAEVISFTSLGSLLKLLSLVSALSRRKVRKFFSRIITKTSRSGNRVELIVTESKDFGLMYRLNCSRLHIQFHYGEWNAEGFPRHNCEIAELSP